MYFQGISGRGVYIYSCGNFDSHKNFLLLCRNIQIRVFRAEIFKSGYFVQKYWSGTVTRYALPSHARLTIWIGPNQTRLSQKILDSDFQTSPENGTKSMHYIIRGKFVISPCRKKLPYFGSVQ